MKVFVSNNYGGEVCKIEFIREDETCYGFGIKIDGFIETNSEKTQHLTSYAKFVQDSFEFKIPRNIIPSFKSKNFLVEYTAECTMIYKERKETFKFPLLIFNNNIGDFDYKEPLFLDLNMEDDTEYQGMKTKACDMLLGVMDLSPGSKGVSEKTVDFVEGGPASFIKKKEESLFPDAPLQLSEETKEIQKMHTAPLSHEKDKEHKAKNFIVGKGKISFNSEDELRGETVPENIKGDKKGDNITGDANNTPLSNPSPSPSLSIPVDRAIHNMNEEPSTIYMLKENLDDSSSKILREKHAMEKEMLHKVDIIQQRLKIPDFREPNLLETKAVDLEYAIYDEEVQIGLVICPSMILRHGWVVIKYLKETKNTYLRIWREDITDGMLIDAECVYSTGFDSESCFEKRFEFTIDGTTLKTFAFSVDFVLIIEIDGREIKIPLLVISPSTLIVKNDRIIYST